MAAITIYEIDRVLTGTTLDLTASYLELQDNVTSNGSYRTNIQTIKDNIFGSLAGGSDKSIQFNSGGTLAGSTGFTFIDGTIGTGGEFYTGIDIPSNNSERLNYNGQFHATSLYANGTLLTNFTTVNSAIFNLTGTGTSGDPLSLSYNTSKASGVFYTGTDNPSSITRLNYDGYLYATRFIATDQIEVENSLLINTSLLNPQVVDGASAIAYNLDTVNNLTTTGAKLLSLNNNTIEKFYIDKDGEVYANGVHLTGAASAVTSVGAGDGMDFTTITGTGNIILGTPSTIDDTSTNGITASSHTHELDIPLSKINNITLTSVIDDQVLIYSGTSWVNYTRPEPLSFGTENQIPFMSGTTDFQYSDNFKWDGNRLIIKQSNTNINIGEGSGNNDALSLNNINIGLNAGTSQTGSVNYNINIGNSAGYSNISALNNIFIGHEAGYSIINSAYQNIGIGFQTGHDLTSGLSNVFIGYQTGQSLATGSTNTFIGTYAGQDIISGTNNIFIGNNSGGNSISGDRNIFIGSQSGNNNTAINNVFVGYYSGYYNTSAISNTYIGYQSGFYNNGNSNTFVGYETGYSVSGSTSVYNTFMGYRAGYKSTGSANVFIGGNAGQDNEGGGGNVYIGKVSGENNISGSTNTFIGNATGNATTGTTGSVFIGNFAGTNEHGDNKLYISNSATNNLIYGEFDNSFLKINGDLSVTGLLSGTTSNVIYYNNTTGSFTYGAASSGGTTVSFGTEYQIPFMTGTTDFEYSNNFKWDGLYLHLTNANASTFIGYNAGSQESGGYSNVAYGYNSGLAISNNYENSFFGYASGINATGNNNTFIGSGSGQNNSIGSGSTFLGYSSGYYETGSNKLFIDNQLRTDEATSRISSLIYGEFNSTVASQLLRINSQLELPQITSATKSDVLYFDSTTNKISYGTAPSGSGTTVSFGTDNQIPFMTGTTDFEYSSNFTWNGTTFILSDGNGSVGIGFGALGINNTGSSNYAIGSNAGGSLTSGAQNIFIGTQAGNDVSTTSYNTIIGDNAGKNIIGQYNTIIGGLAGQNVGSNNTIIGLAAGDTASTGSDNIFIGYQSGRYETGSDKLFIDNQSRTDEATSRTSSLIYGEFNSTVASQLLRINGQLELPQITSGTTSNIIYYNNSTGKLTYNNQVETIQFAVSDETTDLTTGTSKITFRMPYAMTLTGVRANVGTAPTGSNLIVDINESGTTILSTKLSIDATEKTSTTAATAAVISDSSLADDAEITIDIDQIGSTIAGTGLKIMMEGYRV